MKNKGIKSGNFFLFFRKINFGQHSVLEKNQLFGTL